MRRIESIDIVRGIVVVIMALDHSRDLLHISSLTDDPTNLATTTPWLFFTRWITHFCAPIFVFLAGTSVFLQQQKQKDSQTIKKFLFTRGIWLLVLELTVVNFGIWFDVLFRNMILQVIFAIGSGFIILSLLLRFNAVAIGVLGTILVLFHNLLDYVPLQNFPGEAVIRVLFLPGFFKGDHLSVILVYPIMPWLGIMLYGYWAGNIFLLDREKRLRLLTRTGLALLTCFALLRWINLYGDPAPWKVQQNLTYTVLSLLNVTKYPPSLLYTFVTLGGMCLLLALAEWKDKALFRFFRVYGSVPMFFYLIHWYLIHLSMFAMLFYQGFSWNDFSFGNFGFGRPAKVANGLPLGGVYIFWILLILILYPLCLWYGRYKKLHPEKKLLSYL